MRLCNLVKKKKKETNICFSKLTTAVTRSETSRRTMEALPWLHLFHSVALSSWTSRGWSSASWTRMNGTIYEPTPLSLTHVIAAAKGRKLSVMFPSQMIGAGVNKYLCWFYPFPLNTRSRCLTLWCIFFLSSANKDIGLGLVACVANVSKAINSNLMTLPCLCYCLTSRCLHVATVAAVYRC